MVAGAMSLAPNAKNRLNQSASISSLGEGEAKRRDPCRGHGRKDSFGASDDRHSRDLEEQEQECCMCGDVGFSSELFRCRKCVYRFQHTYCSRFYPGSPSQDICDWCSQDPNPSTGSSSAGTSSTKLRGVLKLGGSSVIGGGGGASKRKVAGQLIGESLSPVTGATNWPRKDESDRDTRTKLQGSNDTGKKRDENAMIRNSTGAGSPRSSIKHGHKDALELLLEVAQTVAADNGAMDQTIMGGDAIKNPLARQCSIDRPSSSGRLQVAVTTSSSSPSPKRQKIATTTPVQAGIRGDHHHPHHYHDNDHHHQQQKQQQQQQHHHGFKNLIKGHHGGLRKDKLQHLSSNRSIGRRYKLLSDVMC
ncbi:probable nuclear hormone receptor HR38 [Selaginella moellendorffii]|uniref:probable nuclear hormone receptor HR38 n=1 Tax=Selaginella moellendorffii TaxID=88036 RepID=UPI000D1C8EBE|nr:probable nuclear hormone receptor HR38 [Selaginella moellendorffii]|eukprot:XP_024540896.1 probable nuclear hormone receptor HR38 [Selaginella moellendorffii]